ncbi:MAG TPA: hypothetical protein VNT81_06985 [Vicinamibacterales bacterium]|nr:hypothetical protein [Vicinamibacterales bacterium]
MALRSRYLGIALLTLVTASCAHGVVDELPTAPDPPPATATKLTLTPVGGGTMLAGGASEITSSGPFPSTGATLGAFAQYSDGSGQYVPATWTSSDPNVIAVAGTTLAAIARGEATITASALGLTATEVFRVEPNMAGTWSGRYIVDQCGAGAGSIYEAICGTTAGVLKVGTAAPLTFTITKNGPDLSATSAFGELRGTLTGTDRGQNFLTLKGDLKVNRTTLSVVYWDGRVRTDVMDAFIGFEVRIEGLPSWAQVTAHLDGVTRQR